MILLLAQLGCGGQKKIPTPDAGNPLGGCVLPEVSGSVPSDLYQNTGVVSSTDYAPFSKTLTVNGITLLGWEDNSDQFMLDVATAIEEMFPADHPSIDAAMQQALIQHMYERKTAIPLFVGDDGIDMSRSEEEQFDLLRDNHSICDVIFEYGGDGQTMEVVEHILHHVSMVGLHYSFPDEWGVTQDSILYQSMKEAEDNGYYNHDYHRLIDEPEEAVRVAVQEYAYWVITTGWDIQATYGDGGGGEWTLYTLEAFQNQQPQMYATFQQTVESVMTAPSQQTLDGFE